MGIILKELLKKDIEEKEEVLEELTEKEIRVLELIEEISQTPQRIEIKIKEIEKLTGKQLDINLQGLKNSITRITNWILEELQ